MTAVTVSPRHAAVSSQRQIRASSSKARVVPRIPYLRYVGRGLSYGLLLNALLVAFLVIVFPMIRGAVPLTVLSNSMSPTMPVGSLAIVAPTHPLVDDSNAVLTTDDINSNNDVADIVVGDIIAYQPNSNDPMLIMHRVQNISTVFDTGDSTSHRSFITQGDNVPVADPTVYDYQVRGRVLYVLPLLGWVNQYVNAGENSRAYLVAAICTGYGLAGFYVVQAIRARGRR